MLQQLGVPAGEAVRRMTALPAEIFQLHDRGRLEPEKLADLFLFDPEKWDSQADFQAPHTIATGVAGVWIGGQQVR
jgi:N-acyl-D-aspartate/D-glutamate deacylase